FNIRIKNGVAFKGPFLDEILEFVNTEAAKRVHRSGLSKSDKEIGFAVVMEVQKLLRDGLSKANGLLNESESEMQDPKDRIKTTYDQPNLEVANAPVATDLYCLAHTDRVEIDNKQLKAS